MKIWLVIIGSLLVIFYSRLAYILISDKEILDKWLAISSAGFVLALTLTALFYIFS